MNKGKLVFESPKTSGFRLFLAVALGLIGILSIAGVLYDILFVEFHPIKLIIILLLSAATFGLPISISYSRFSIYEYGITHKLEPQEKIIKKEGKYIGFDDIEYFEISPKRMHCIVYVKGGDKIDYFNKSIPQESIEILIKALKEHNIKEVQLN